MTAGQAGTRVDCPSCGAAVDVPRLRDLASLRPPDVDGRRPTWDAARGITFAGVAVALVAGLAASTAVPLGGLFVATPPRPDEVRRAVATLPISVVHAACSELALSGLNRTPSPVEKRYAQFMAATRGLVRVLWGVAAVAVVVAVAGMVARAAGSPGDAGP